MQVRVRLDTVAPRRWHADLARRLAAAMQAAVDLVPGSPDRRSEERDLHRVLAVERVLNNVRCEALTPVGEHEQPGPDGAGSADVVIDLGSHPRADRTSWTVLYDGEPGVWAAAAALRQGRFPVVSVLDPGGTVRAVGRPGSEQPGLLAVALADVLAGVVTLLVGGLQGHTFAAPIPAVPEGAPQTGSASLGRTVARHLMREVMHGTYRALTRAPHWRVGWRRRDDADVLGTAEHPETGWTDLPDDGHHFYADPFLFEHHGRTYLFVEDYDHRAGKAVISVVELGDEGPLGPPRQVLAHDVHLSYPVVVEHDGEVWMIPETSAGGTIELYRATRFPDAWQREAVLVDGVSASDATPFHHDGRWWLSATVRHGGSYSDHLHLWSAPDLRGPWTPHAGNPVLVDIASARPAGHVVRRDGRLLRPTQDCRDGYGVALNVMEVTRLDDDGFEQQQVGRLAAGERWPGRRLHTYNNAGQFEVIDGSRINLRLPRRARAGRRRSGLSTTADKRTRPRVVIANPSADVYGSDLQMLESVEALVSGGLDVTVTTPGDGPLIPLIRERGASVERMGYPVLKRADASGFGLVRLGCRGANSAMSLTRYLRRDRPALLYVNTVTLPWWIVSARLAGVPVLCHVHEAERQDSELVRLALYLPLVLAQRIVVNSEVTGETIAEAFKPLARRATLVYNGVAGPPAAPSPLAEDTDPLRLVLVSRLSPRKGIDVALEALACMRRTGLDARLDICGTTFLGYEWFEEQLRARSEQEDLRGAVTFSGYVSPVWPALERAHVALAPSMGESLGNAVIEAQLAGRPVVASEVSGHVETVEDGRTGLLVPVRDPSALASAVMRLVRAPALAASLVEHAHRDAQERFSLERYQQEVRAVVRDLVTDSPLRNP